MGEIFYPKRKPRISLSDVEETNLPPIELHEMRQREVLKTEVEDK